MRKKASGSSLPAIASVGRPIATPNWVNALNRNRGILSARARYRRLRAGGRGRVARIVYQVACRGDRKRFELDRITVRVRQPPDDSERYDLCLRRRVRIGYRRVGASLAADEGNTGKTFEKAARQRVK